MGMKLSWGEVAEFRRRRRPGPWNWRAAIFLFAVPLGGWLLVIAGLKGCR